MFVSGASGDQRDQLACAGRSQQYVAQQFHRVPRVRRTGGSRPVQVAEAVDAVHVRR